MAECHQVAPLDPIDHFLIKEDDRDQLNIIMDIENLVGSKKWGQFIEFSPGNGKMDFQIEL